MASARQYDDRGPAGSAGTRRSLGVVPLAALALVGSVVVLVTVDPLQVGLLLAVLVWALVGGAFVVGSRRADRLAAEQRDAELRHAHELELEREVASRRERELSRENQLRRESEQAMRTELARLREDLAVLAGGDGGALSRLREDLADLGDLRNEIAALAQLRAELSGIGELRNDVGRIRAELGEQLTGELMVERMVMRAQAVRLPADRNDETRTILSSDDAPIGSAWEGTRWEETRVDRALPGVVTAVQPTPQPAPQPVLQPAPQVAQAPARPVVEGHRRPPVPPRARPQQPSPDVEPAPDVDAAARPRSPMEWLVAESLVEPAAASGAGSPVDVPVEPTVQPRADRVELPATPTPARRHRRAAEPDDEDLLAPAPPRSHAAPETAVGIELTPYRLGAESGGVAGDSWSAGTPSWSSDSPSWSDQTPSWSAGTPSWSADTPSWSAETPSWSSDAPSWSADSLSRSAADSLWSTPAAPTAEPAGQEADDGRWSVADEQPGWSTGSTSWADSTPSWSGSTASWADSTPSRPADRPAEPATPGAGATDAEPTGRARLAEILAQNDRPQPSGRRRRRYRDEDEAAAQDDVLARVLGRS